MINKLTLLLFITPLILSCSQHRDIDEENALNKYLDIKGNVKSFTEETRRLNQSNADMVIKSVIVNDTCIQENYIFNSNSINRIILTEESLSNESISNEGIPEFTIVFGKPYTDSSYCIVNDRGNIKRGYVKYLHSGYIKEYHADDCEGFFEYDKSNNLTSMKIKRKGNIYSTIEYAYLSFDSIGNWTERLQTIKVVMDIKSIQYREYKYELGTLSK